MQTLLHVHQGELMEKVWIRVLYHKYFTGQTEWSKHFPVKKLTEKISHQKRNWKILTMLCGYKLCFLRRNPFLPPSFKMNSGQPVLYKYLFCTRIVKWQCWPDTWSLIFDRTVAAVTGDLLGFSEKINLHSDMNEQLQKKKGASMSSKFISHTSSH